MRSMLAALVCLWSTTTPRWSLLPILLQQFLELDKEHYSCSIQLTNKTERIVAYFFRPFRSSTILLESPDPERDVGTILPRSTSSVTLTVYLLGKEPENREWIDISASVVKDGVKAEDITRENLFRLIGEVFGFFRMPVVYYYSTVVPAANPSSAVPKRIEEIALTLATPGMSDSKFGPDSHFDDLLTVHPTALNNLTLEGKGSKSIVTKQSSNEIMSIIVFSDDEIKDATNDLSNSSKIGYGGYGSVYKGNLHGIEVAIKMLDSDSEQGIAEFLQEMEVLGRTKHQNLVKLIGACIKLRALVYEFLPHGSVEDYLKKDPRLLTWQIRTRIVYEICSALTFLHSRRPQPVVHGDLKPANILLDANFISKLSDFGLCRFLPRGTTTTTTTSTTSVAFLQTKNIKGTEWYIDPDFLITGKLTTGCDVYSFGITILRLLTGVPAPRVYRNVNKAIREKSLMRAVDSTAGKWPKNVAEYLAHMGLECCEPERSNSKLMKDLSTGLEDILAKMDT